MGRIERVIAISDGNGRFFNGKQHVKSGHFNRNSQHRGIIHHNVITGVALMDCGTSTFMAGRGGCWDEAGVAAGELY